MKKLIFSFIFFTSVFLVFGQCTIDYNYYPFSANYGLDPDSLPDAYIGQFYDEDMTFFLPLDTVQSGVNVTFTDFHITSISLPLGLTWECDNSLANCHYDPGVNQYGCVKVSGYALIPGNFDVEVSLVATHSLSALAGTENITFSLPLEILPDTTTSSNVGFAMSNPSGCAPVTVNFSNNLMGMLSYHWDFGNGNTSTLAQPSSQIYNIPGQYIVHYTATQTAPSFYLQNIEVLSGNCTDNWPLGDPDFFYTVSTQAVVLEEVLQANSITQNFPLTINNFNPLLLTGQSVTVDLKEDDSPLPTSVEDCGILSFVPVQQSGTHSANGGGLAINYTVIEVPAFTETATDTIYVYDYPPIPNIVYDTLNNLMHTNLDSVSMQWYYYNSPIPGATDTFIEPMSSGLYSLVVVNQYGCTSISDEVLVVICNNEYQPLLDDNGLTAWMLDSALYTNLQWYDGNGIIVGANQPFFPSTVSGFYHIVATDEFGCNYSSESVFLGHTNTESVAFSELVKLGPNPISNGSPLNIMIENTDIKNVKIVLTDLHGRVVISKKFNYFSDNYQIAYQEIEKLVNGIYYLDILFDGNQFRSKIVKIAVN